MFGAWSVFFFLFCDNLFHSIEILEELSIQADKVVVNDCNIIQLSSIFSSFKYLF